MFCAEYDAAIQALQEEGIVEVAPTATANKEFYILNKGVVKESSETIPSFAFSTMLWQRKTHHRHLLTTSPYPRRPLQNKIWDVLMQQRSFPEMVSSDIRLAFLKIRMKEMERDVLRFHWDRGELSRCTLCDLPEYCLGWYPLVVRFTVLSRLICMDSWSKTYPEEVED